MSASLNSDGMVSVSLTPTSLPSMEEISKASISTWDSSSPNFANGTSSKATGNIATLTIVVVGSQKTGLRVRVTTLLATTTDLAGTSSSKPRTETPAARLRTSISWTLCKPSTTVTTVTRTVHTVIGGERKVSIHSV